MSKEKMIDPGKIQFFDNEVPGLSAGSYSIFSKLSLPNTETDQFTQTIHQQFDVNGPQFSIEPSEIQTLFPANESNGDFSQALPYIVLDTPALPWERRIGSGADPAIPWLALLVFRENEIEINPTTHSPLITTTVADFLKLETGIAKPAIPVNSVSAALLASSMNSIRISPEIFQAMTPRLVELSTLAHLREVNTADKAVGDNDVDNFFSVIMANRFPQSSAIIDQAAVVNYVHLVSLEEWGDYLVDAPAWPAGTTKVQLVSLANWRFVSARQPGETFSELAQHLVDASGGDADSLLLRIPVTDDGGKAAERIKISYTALTSHLLTGADSFCWYRGPFTAAPAQALPNSIPSYRHPSAAMIYDQEHAIFDNSYAAAWSIGRLTALADPGFIDSIQVARKKIIHSGTRLLERSVMPQLAGITDFRELLAPGLTRKAFSLSVKQGMSDTLMQSFIRVQGEKKISRAARRNHLYPNEELPSSPAAEMEWFFRKKEVSDFLGEWVKEEIEPLSTWLANLALLYNLPFNHLVPDQRMLPVESIRFFYIDQGWIKVLLDGALSIGVHGSKAQLANDILMKPVLDQTLKKVVAERSRLLGMKMEQDTITPGLPMAGMLLRSALVSGWPGLAINTPATTNPARIMRIDRVAPNILLVLWDKLPDTITVSQPEQSLEFGVSDGSVIQLRSLASSNLGAPMGTFPSSGDGFNQFMRPLQNNVGGMVLNLVPAVKGTSGYLVPALSQALSQQNNITASSFALQMVKVPQQVAFTITGNSITA